MPKFPGYHLVPASLWVNLHPSKQELLRKAGGIPVNDIFLTMWERPATTKRELLFPFGTYGSGKTVDRVQELILTCVCEPYFKCYYGMKTFDRAKSELHSVIVRMIETMGLKHLFDYSTKPNGTKVIQCIANGNLFKPFGCDDEESFKGWDEPTHVLLDEVNQIEFKHYGMLQSRLRRKGCAKAFIGCFNNCDVDDQHWIVTELRSEGATLTDMGGKTIDRNIIWHFSTFRDNHFIDQDDYYNQLIEQAGNDPVRRSAVINGDWGAKSTKHPFYKNFNPRGHAGHTEYNPNLALHVAFDENKNPYLPVGVFQCVGTEVYMIDEIAAVNPNNLLSWVCEELLRRYGPGGKDHKENFYIYGDATSQKDDVKLEKGKNMFTMMKGYLSYFRPKIRSSKANPNVGMRGDFINAVFGRNYGGIKVTIGHQCKHAIADFVNTAEAPDGSGKDKTKVQVDGIRGVQKWGHFSDLFDYFMCECYMTIYLRFQRDGKPEKWVSSKRKPHNVI
jgi:hypothetical protein